MHTLLQGLWLAIRHAWKGMGHYPRFLFQPGAFRQKGGGAVTIAYPHQQLPVPENGHYRLHVAIEDCIGCDLCVRICPVSCITLHKEKADTLLGRTASGHPRRFHLPRFDIDHALCCFCGLCTVVCPTECLTMRPDYGYATLDRNKLVHRFGERECVPAEPKNPGGRT